MWLRGMTLVELVVVMTLVGILALVVVPRFAARDDVNVRTSARQLAADIRYAQTRSIATRVRHGVAVNTSAGAWTVYRVDPSTPVDDFLNPGTPMRRHPDGVAIASVTFDAATRVEFDSMGTPRTPGGELGGDGVVVLAAGTNVDTVRVTPITGRVSF